MKCVVPHAAVLENESLYTFALGFYIYLSVFRYWVDLPHTMIVSLAKSLLKGYILSHLQETSTVLFI